VGSSFAEKDQRLLVDNKLYMSQQCTLAAVKADYIEDCIRRSVCSSERQVIFSSEQHM